MLRNFSISRQSKCIPSNKLSKSLFDSYEEKVAFDLADLYHLLSIQNRLAGFEVNERFYEIGSHQGIKETELYLSAI